jgi:thiol:disulfide interchange protein
MLQKIRFGRAPVVLGALLLIMAIIWLARPEITGPPPTGVGAYAIQTPAPSAVLAAIPELKTQPVLLEFRTRLCRDCQALAPVLQALAKQHPDVRVLVYDVETSREKRPAIFELFQPVTVPTLVGLNQQGQVKQVLYERPDDAALQNLMTQLKG